MKLPLPHSGQLLHPKGKGKSNRKCIDANLLLQAHLGVLGNCPERVSDKFIKSGKGKNAERRHSVREPWNVIAGEGEGVVINDNYT